MKSQITAVGRLLKPALGQQQLFKVISIKQDGTSKVIVNRPLAT